MADTGQDIETGSGTAASIVGINILGPGSPLGELIFGFSKPPRNATGVAIKIFRDLIVSAPLVIERLFGHPVEQVSANIDFLVAQAEAQLAGTVPLHPVGIPTPINFPTPINLPTGIGIPPPLGSAGSGLPVGFPVVGARGISEPSRGPAGPGGFNAANFIRCLISSLLPSSQGGRMPFQITPGPQASSGGFDFGGFLQSGINLASQFFAPKPVAPTPFFPQTINLPGVQQAGFGALAPLLGRGLTGLRTQLPSFASGGLGGAAAEGLFGFFGGADTADDTAAFTDPVPGACRPKAHIKVNPCTGKGTWFSPRGKPLVFSGDMAACKRVDRVAKRLDKARPKRRHHHHPR